jgi:ethanolaminephosphotransferase
MKFLYTPYLGKRDIEGIHKYKYAGDDQGLAYIYFYNPVVTKLVEYLPDWLAPNVITLLGFLISFIPAVILFCVYG